MARSSCFGFNPAFADVGAYEGAGSSSFTIVTSPAPGQGSYRFHVEGAGVARVLQLPASTIQKSLKTYSATYRWACLRERRVSGTLVSGDEILYCIYGSRLAPVVQYVSASTYNLQIYDTLNNAYVGSAFGPYSVDTDYADRIQTDGSTVKFWVDGTLVLSASSTTQLANNIIFMRSGYTAEVGTYLQSGQHFYYSGYYSAESSSESDRPGTSVAGSGETPDGDLTSSTYGDHSTGCPADGTGTYTEWDDLASGGSNDGDTTFNKACGADAGTEESTLTANGASLSNLANAVAILISIARSDIGGKTVTWYGRLGDGSGTSEVQMSNLNQTSYKPWTCSFQSPPTGAWEDSGKIAALTAGVRTIASNGDNDVHSALGLEIITIDDDPPSEVTTEGDPQNFRRWTSP